MKTIKNIGLWLLTGFFTLAAIIYLISTGSFITGVLCLLCALLCCPITHKALKSSGKMPKTWVLPVIVLFLFIASVAALPVSARSYSAKSKTTEAQNNIHKESSIVGLITSIIGLNDPKNQFKSRSKIGLGLSIGSLCLWFLIFILVLALSITFYNDFYF